MISIPDQDEYGTVFNSQRTYTAIADNLYDFETGRLIIMAWTDERGSQLDIMFTYKPMQYGLLQRGLSAHTDLFVSVMGWGAFGFEINDLEKHPGYVGEKLHMTAESITTVKLAELINGVIKELLNE